MNYLKVKTINTAQNLLLFGIPSVLFVIVCRILIPELNQNYHVHPALSWFIGGLLVFVPLFLLAFYLVRKDGYQTKKKISAGSGSGKCHLMIGNIL